MTNEEAEQLVGKVEHDVRRSYVMPTYYSWAFAGLTTPFWFVTGFSTFALPLSGILATVALCVTAANQQDLKGLNGMKAIAVWRSIHTRSLLGRELYLPTWELKEGIERLYEHDLCGEVLPLVQAIRLLDAHHRQQKRLVVVYSRLKELQVLRQTMHEKLAQLRTLGEDAPDAKRRLTELERDEAALQSIHNQISASCARLETIFTSVQHAHQVRQLKRELGELSQVAGSSSDLALESDAFDIERQIGREIETFLRLERETDAHLRDV